MFVLMTTCTKPVVSTLIKIAALVAALLFLSAGHVIAAGDAIGSFDESGRYNYHAYSGPGRPSIGQPGYEEERRAQESFDSSAERWRKESLQQEQERQVIPARPPAYKDGYWIQGPGGAPAVFCMPGYKGITVTCQ